MFSRYRKKVKLTIQQRDLTENNVAIIKQLQEEEKEIQAAKDIHISMVTLLSCTSINTYIITRLLRHLIT